MPSTPPIPTYTVVGHPNEGKSSVVATLTEDDSVRISAIPGETTHSRTYPVQIDGRTVIQFVDTPGFQHPRKILDWFRTGGADQGNLAREFVQSHSEDPELAHDIELLKPLSEGCGIIYVIDGSRLISTTDRIEMEILRLTGNPRMAIINPKEYDEEIITEWKAACAKAFNSIRIFNAHKATYAERIALLESLKGINQDWEGALAQTIEAFEEDWSRRIHQVAGILCELIREASSYTQSKSIFSPGEEEAARSELQTSYNKNLHKKERDAHQTLRKLFKHNIFQMDIPPHSILHEDLFTSRTWQVLGLSKKQIVSTAAVLGGGIGVQLDLVAAGLTFGLFTVSGAVAGAMAAWLRGEDLARTEIKKQKLGGIKITVGPNTNPQLPFILIDRGLLYFQHVSNWAHARSKPSETPSDVIKFEPAKMGFTTQWTDQQRKSCLQFIKVVTNNAPYEKQAEAERKCRRMLEECLHEISQPTSKSPSPSTPALE